MATSCSGTPSLEKSEGTDSGLLTKNTTIATNPTSTNPSVPLLYYLPMATSCSGTPSLEKSEGTNSRLLTKNATIATNPGLAGFGTFSVLPATLSARVAKIINENLMYLSGKCKIAKNREHVNIATMIAALRIPVFTMFTA